MLWKLSFKNALSSLICLNVFRFRILCHKLCNHPYYCNVILCCILMSSVMLAAEDPLYAKIERNQVNYDARRLWLVYCQGIARGSLATSSCTSVHNATATVMRYWNCLNHFSYSAIVTIYSNFPFLLFATSLPPPPAFRYSFLRCINRRPIVMVECRGRSGPGNGRLSYCPQSGTAALMHW